ncbi:ubiquinol oxidase subunit II [Bradyrhizobium sp.]|uniref:ubiquinol oxidase subunit II n=1 Tax=Bradyrhizobium sp. TaxID=376 RepID=UPI003C493A89
MVSCLLLTMLSGCNAVVLDPAGDVALQQRNLLAASTGLMLLIIIPVIALTLLFAWRYRASNQTARYEPDWDHSTQLELIIWASPLLIIICLGAITWVGTHILDPYRPIERISSSEAVAPGTKPLVVQVVALDWKWLFIYPELGVATVNELAAPVGRPIDFVITSSSVMNSFYVPALAGQIYAMPGMETKLHAVINKAGEYQGFSANYSGAGFSDMRFRFHGQDSAEFDQWLSRVKDAGETLDRDRYLQLERPTEAEPVRYFSAVAPDLYHAVVNMCVQPGKMCMDEMTRIDAAGGLGLAGVNNVIPLEYDKYARRGSPLGMPPSMVASLCEVPKPPAGGTNYSSRLWPRDPAGLAGAGLPRPPLSRLRAADAAALATSNPIEHDKQL